MSKIRHILMVEDDLDDQEITSTTLADLKMDIPIQFISRGDDIFKTLTAPDLPALILIDYNMHPENGAQIIRKLKNDSRYKAIPVVVLSGTASPATIRECYESGASCFVKKPSSLEDTRRKIKAFFQYWLEVAEI